MSKNDKLMELILEYQKTKNIIVLNKIIDLNKNLINWFLKNTKFNISKEDLYSIIIKGLEHSISLYDKDKYYNVVSYISFGIRNIIYLNQIHIERDKNRLFASFLEYKKIIEKRYGVTLEKDFSLFDDIIDLMLEDGIIRKDNKEDIKKILIEFLKDYYGSLKIMNAKESNEIVDSNIEIPTDNSYIKRILMNTLTAKEYNCLVSHYGLFGNDSHSLEEIGKREHVSRANINEIKNNALDKLRYIFRFYNQKPIWNIDINNFRLLLLKLLSKEEYLYLTSYYGLFGKERKSYKELEEIYHVSAKNISEIVNRVISKIFFYIESQDIEFPYSEEIVDNVLKKNLSHNEYKTFASIYGLFGRRLESVEEYANLNRISKGQVSDFLVRANFKIRNIVRKNKTILNFLQTILTEEEFECLSLRYGLFTGKLITVREVAKKVQKASFEVSKVINLALEKIIIKIKFINIKIDKELVQEILQSLLTEEEYTFLCQSYGIFGYEKNLDEKKLVRTNINSFTRVASILNIESKER